MSNRLLPLVLDRLKAKPRLYRSLQKAGRLQEEAERLANEVSAQAEQIRLHQRRPDGRPQPPGELARLAAEADAQALDAALPVDLAPYR